MIKNFKMHVLAALCCLPWGIGVNGEEEESPGTELRSDRESGYDSVTGYYPKLELPQQQPRVLWRFTSKTVRRRGGGMEYTPGLSDMIVRDGVVYFGDDDGSVRALRATDGAKRWQHHHGFRIATSPTADEAHVYFATETGVSALDKKTGAAVWFVAAAHGASEASPLPIGESLFYAGYDGMAHAVNKNTGVKIWEADLVGDAPEDPPGFSGERARFQGHPARPRGSACDGKTFFQCVFDQCRVVAFDCQSGKQRWSFQTRGWVGAAPTIAGGNVFIGSQDDHMYCLNKDTGRQVWKFKTGSRISSRAAVNDDSVFFPSCDGWLYRVSIMSGQLIWKFQTKPAKGGRTSTYSFPIVTKNLVCFAAGEGQIYAVDIETGELKWKFRPCEGSELYTNPATDGSRIFVMSRKGSKGVGKSEILAIGLE